MRQHAADPGQRLAQHLLATEILTLVHGEEVAAQTREQHAAMRNPSIAVSGSGGGGGEESAIPLPCAEVVDVPWTRVLARAGLAASGGEASRMISQGSVYLATPSSSTATAAGDENDKGGLQFQPVKNPRSLVREEDLLEGKLLVRIGKWKVRVIEVEGDVGG